MKKYIPNVTQNVDLGTSQSPEVERSDLAHISNMSDNLIVPTTGAFASFRNQILNHIRYTCCFLLFTSTLCFADKSIPTGYKIVENQALLPILSPSVALRKTAKLILDNGMQVYLISDPQTEQSGASLTVEVGSWSDPKEYPGMAHFLEHMLFMGTKAYPKEAEYTQYISENGGSVNAFTASDRTAYIFSINNDAFTGALDRFSHFFIDPLFLPSGISRELYNVDQEHSKNIENDGWRQLMVFKENSNPNHPISAFSTGNAQTLGGIPQKALKDWYTTHYTAEQMHLVVISSLPLENLIALVQKDFSQVASHPAKAVPMQEQMLSSKLPGHMLYLKPVKDLRRITLMWEIPQEFLNDGDRWTVETVRKILSSEAPGSLLQLLKTEKIAEGLQTSVDRFSKEQGFFEIEIALTPYGVTQVDRAINETFQTLELIKEKGIPDYVFEEMRIMKTLQYQYQTRDDVFDLLMGHASAIVYEDLASYPQKSLVPTLYDPNHIHTFTQILTPQNCAFSLMADPSMVQINPDKKEKWMQAEYAIREVPHDTLVTLSHLPLNPKIQLPGRNPFIPTQVNLVPVAQEKAPPQLLINDAGGKVYFLQDLLYGVPELNFIFGVKTALLDGSTKQIVLTDLYLRALSEELAGIINQATEAGASINFYQKDYAIEFNLHGFSQTLPLITTEIATRLKNSATEEQFQLYKQSLLSSYENRAKELPISQARQQLANILYNDAPLSIDKAALLHSMNYEDYLQFVSQLFHSYYTEGMIYGNQSRADALNLLEILRKTIDGKAYLQGENKRRQLLLLPDHLGPYMLIEKTPRQGNGALLLIEEGPFSFKTRASQQIIGSLLDNDFFETLRTKQHTGYMVHSWNTEEQRQLLQFFAVQSNSHNPVDLIARFELFIEGFLKELPEMLTETKFERLRNSWITTLKIPPENLSLMTARLYNLAFNCEADFDLYEKRIESFEKLKLEDVLQAAPQLLARNNRKRLAILVEGVLSPENNFRYEVSSKEEISGVSTYSNINWK